MTEATHHPASDRGLHERVGDLTDRRGVLKVVGVGVVVGAGALAACSSPTAAVPSSNGAAQGSAGGTPTSEIPVGGGKVFADSQTVVTQPTAGTYKAFDAVCPHQGCIVGSVEGGQIICPCHQSHFDAATGNVVSGPAATGLTAKKITVTGGTFAVS